MVQRIDNYGASLLSGYSDYFHATLGLTGEGGEI